MKKLIYFIIALLLVVVFMNYVINSETTTTNKENTSLTITEPGNYDVSKYDEIIVDIESVEINLQDKTITPGEITQTVIPDSNYNGLGTVTVNPIPDDYINPDGSIDIIENGTYDVTNFESVNVNIPITSYTEWDGSYQQISNVETLQDSSIPEGYRLLTSEDVGKTFGVDLESKIYIDSSVIPNTFTSASDYIPLVIFENTSLEIFINDPLDQERNVGIFAFSTYNGETPTDGYTLYSDASGDWTSSNVDLVNNLELTYTIKEVYFGGTFSGSNIEVEENTWLYVKDYIPDPYVITIKNENGIELLTKDQLLTDTVKIKVDESLLTQTEAPYTTLIVNTGNGDLDISVPNDNGILESITIAAGESLTVKHYGLLTWVRGGVHGYSWEGITYAPETYGTYYFIQTGDTTNVYTLTINVVNSSGGAS